MTTQGTQTEEFPSITATIEGGCLCIKTDEEVTHLFMQQLSKVVGAVLSLYEQRPIQVAVADGDTPDGYAFYEFVPHEGELVGPLAVAGTLAEQVTIPKQAAQSAMAQALPPVAA